MECVGGRFKSEGTYVYLWLIHTVVGQKPTEHCKAIILHLKINKSNVPNQTGKKEKKESACQCRGLGLSFQSRKIPRAMGQLSPCGATPERTGPRNRALQQEKPQQAEADRPQLERSPCSLQLHKALAQ